MKKLTVGLTGGIGAGKSTVAEMLRAHGAEIVSGDSLGREVLDSEADVREKLIARLGSDIVLPTGELDRKLIASRIFIDQESTNWLTSLTFLEIHARWHQRRDASSSPIIVFDAALIFEWGIERQFDLVLVIYSSFSETVARARGRFSESELLERAAMQIPVDAKISGATCAIKNDGTLEELKNQVDNFWSQHILTRI